MPHSRSVLAAVAGLLSHLPLLFATPPTTLKDIQLLHAHNSYKLCIDPTVKAAYNAPQAAPLRQAFNLSELEYGHPSLTDLLTGFGVRSLEIDMLYDNVGGLYQQRAAPKLAHLLDLVPGPAVKQSGVEDDMSGPTSLLTPGWKVLHNPDFDYRSSCATLTECLREVKAWRDQHPSSGPLFVRLEPRVHNPQSSGLSGSLLTLLDQLLGSSAVGAQHLARSPPASVQQVQEIERDVLSTFRRDQVFTPDDLRLHFGSALERVRAQGYPDLQLMQDKVIFVLVGRSAFTDLNWAAYPGARNALLFNEVYPEDLSPVTANDTVFLQLGDVALDNQTTAAVVSGKIKALVQSGHLVRAFADYATRQARDNDVGLRDAVISGGAHFVATDYPGRLTSMCAFESPYSVELRGGPAGGSQLSSACNPLTAPRACLGAGPQEQGAEPCLCEQLANAAAAPAEGGRRRRTRRRLRMHC